MIARPRRRPIGSLLTALLVWLTAVGVARVAHPDAMRLVAVEATGATGVVLVVPSAPAVAPPRLPTRPSAIPQLELPFPAAVQAVVPVPPHRRLAPAQLARARSDHGLASTYDATAPPPSTGGR